MAHRVLDEPVIPTHARVSRLPAWLRAMRPKQWTKNGIVFAAMVFDQRFFELDAVLRSLAGALVFCAVSSGIYLINDLKDVEQDKVHPVKKNRAIAAGELKISTAMVLSALLLVGGLGMALALGPAFAGVILAYIAVMIAYSFGLKHIVILDVILIAAGFVGRAAGGALAIDVPISPWLYLCTLLLALFLGFGKRRNELTLLTDDAKSHRASLDDYTLPLLDQLIAVVAASTIMAYSLYTFDASTVPANHAMMLTIPFVAFAIFRYLYLIHRKHLGGSPENLLFSDRPLLVCILGWGITAMTTIYLT